MKTHAFGMSLLAALAIALPLGTAHAANKINGKQCAGMVSTQRNPQTDEVTRSCRTVDGDIATEKVPSRTKKKSKPTTTNTPPTKK